MTSRLIKALSTLSWLLLVGANASGAYAHGSKSDHTCPVGTVHHHDLGDHSFTISSSDETVQKLFNQGINWAYGFNHAEAEVNFRAAAAIDSACAMCYWGIAYVLGPNINAPMAAEAVTEAYIVAQKALALGSQATVKEQALIQALAKRYQAIETSDRQQLDYDYAIAMMALTEQYLDDMEIGVLAVDAMMNTMPWNYWLPNGEPREGTEDMIAILNKVLEVNPLHPGANHFLIHIVEKERPELAEQAADRLVDLVPDSGHLQHMASHIYIRLGRYHDAVLANQRGIKADQAYLASCPQDSLYQNLYVPHNYDFLVAAAYLLGNQKLAIETARELRDLVEPAAKEKPELIDLQQFWSTPYVAYLRFEQWQTILEAEAPPQNWPYARGIWHFGRAMAKAKIGDFDSAAEEIRSLETIAQAPEMTSALLAGLNPASQVLSIGIQEAKGLLAASRNNLELAVSHLERAVMFQDALTYIEPPAWYRSVRLELGQVLLLVGRYAEAEQVFQDDLEEFPLNGWALSGLYQSLIKQNRIKEAGQIQQLFQVAWQHADFDLPSPQVIFK